MAQTIASTVLSARRSDGSASDDSTPDSLDALDGSSHVIVPREWSNVSVDEVIITSELERRHARPANLAAESRALHAIGRELAGSHSHDVLGALLDASLEICGAGTAGVSLLETTAEGLDQFCWVRLAGQLQGHVGATARRDASPCGIVLDRDAAQLFDRPMRAFVYPEGVNIHECLIVPFRAADGLAIGTLWLASHEDSRHFDSEDVRIMTSLADFAAFAFARVSADHERERLHAAERCARAELAEACDRLRRADSRKDEFLAMLGHELRNPLGAIANAITLLENQPEATPRTIKLADVVRRQTRVMTQLLDDLLDVSRITLGKLELRRRRVELARIVRQVADNLGKEATARKHEVTVDVRGGLWAFADPTRLEQIVGNLLTNAIKYTDRGGHISIWARREDDYLVLSIRDNGMGIAPEFLPYVFDLLSQGVITNDRAHGGLGLGLTLVQRLVDLHGGRVEARSEGAGQGSEFIVRLPAADVELPPGGPDATGDIVVIVPHGSRMRILVVDDDTDSAALSGEMLTLLGHEPHVVNDPESALRAADASDWDLILLDIGLPRMDGYEVTRRIRQGRNRKTRLVAVSGFGGLEDRQRSFHAGCDEHLVKPVGVTDLRDVLGRALGLLR